MTIPNQTKRILRFKKIFLYFLEVLREKHGVKQIFCFRRDFSNILLL